jgi:Flp pilus assembly protein TadD
MELEAYMKSISLLILVFLVAGASAEPQTAKAKVFIEQGKLSLAAGDLPKAQENFEKARAADPKNALPASGLGNVAASQGRTADAITNFKICLKLDPKNKDCRANLAKLELAKPKH